MPQNFKHFYVALLLTSKINKRGVWGNILINAIQTLSSNVSKHLSWQVRNDSLIATPEKMLQKNKIYKMEPTHIEKNNTFLSGNLPTRKSYTSSSTSVTSTNIKSSNNYYYGGACNYI